MSTVKNLIGSISPDITTRVEENEKSFKSFMADHREKVMAATTLKDEKPVFDDKDNEEFGRLVSDADAIELKAKQVQLQLYHDIFKIRMDAMSADVRKDKEDKRHKMLRAFVGFADHNAPDTTRGRMSPEDEQEYIIETKHGVGFNPYGTALTKSGAGSDTSAAGTEVPTIDPMIIHNLKSYGAIRKFAELQDAPNGKDHVFVDEDTTTATAQVNGLDIPSTATTTGEAYPAPTQQILKIATVSATSPYVVSREALDDSDVNLAQSIIDSAYTRTWRSEGLLFTQGSTNTIITGLGWDSLQGIAQTGVTAASATAITFDELVNLEQSIDIAYIEGAENAAMMDGAMMMSSRDMMMGQVAWNMHQTTWGVVRRLKDNDNRPIFQPNLMMFTPKSIFGWPVIINNQMQQIATGNTSLVFGNGSYLCIRQVPSGSFLGRFSGDVFGLKNHIAFKYFDRVGIKCKGALVNTGTTASPVYKCEAFKALVQA